MVHSLRSLSRPPPLALDPPCCPNPQVRDLDASHKALQEHVLSLQAELQKVRLEHEGRGAASALADDLRRARTDNEALTHANARLEARLATLGAEVRLSGVGAQIDHQEKRMSELQDALMQQRTAHARNQQRSLELEEERDGLRGEVEALQQELAHQHSGACRQQERCAALEVEAAELQRQREQAVAEMQVQGSVLPPAGRVAPQRVRQRGGWVGVSRAWTHCGCGALWCVGRVSGTEGVTPPSPSLDLCYR